MVDILEAEGTIGHDELKKENKGEAKVRSGRIISANQNIKP
jgi:hypothetical protein